METIYFLVVATAAFLRHNKETGPKYAGETLMLVGPFHSSVRS
jgi:hypothetical protein